MKQLEGQSQGQSQSLIQIQFQKIASTGSLLQMLDILSRQNLGFFHSLQLKPEEGIRHYIGSP